VNWWVTVIIERAVTIIHEHLFIPIVNVVSHMHQYLLALMLYGRESQNFKDYTHI